MRFHGLNAEDFVDTINNTDGIAFGKFNSIEAGLFLIERNAPTPDEKEVVEDIPYLQGQYDFSTLSGYSNERFFKNRQITYKFLGLSDDYETRAIIERRVKHKLMLEPIQALYDTHDINYHWKGKCKSVKIDDDADTGTISIEIVFDCYPLAIRNHSDTEDIWDEVYFEDWHFENLRYTIKGKTTINLDNWGGSHVTGEFKLISGKVTYVDRVDSNRNITLDKVGDVYKQSIVKGKSNRVFDGDGVIELRYVKTEML